MTSNKEVIDTFYPSNKVKREEKRKKKQKIKRNCYEFYHSNENRRFQHIKLTFPSESIWNASQYSRQKCFDTTKRTTHLLILQIISIDRAFRARTQNRIQNEENSNDFFFSFNPVTSMPRGHFHFQIISVWSYEMKLFLSPLGSEFEFGSIIMEFRPFFPSLLVQTIELNKQKQKIRFIGRDLYFILHMKTLRMWYICVS